MSISRSRNPYNRTLMSAVAVTGNSSELDVSEYKNIQLALSSATSCNAVVRVKGSMLSVGDVDFGSAAAPGNEWDYVGVYNLNGTSTGPTYIAGDTGFDFAGTDSVENLLVNVDGLRSICVHATVTVGAVTAKLFAVNNA